MMRTASVELESIQPGSCEIVGPELRRKTCSDKCKDVLTVKTFVLSVVIAAVWVVLLVPTVIYAVLQESSRDECDELLVGCNSSGSGETSNFRDNASLVCSEGFYVSLEDISNGTTVEVCRPECGEWEEFPHSTVVALYVTKTVAGVIYMISGAVVLVLSVMRYKQMFKFPSVFIIYGILSLGMMVFFDLVGKFNQKSLFCSSQDLMKSLDNPTVFCTLSGAVFYYFFLVTALFWLCHISAVCWGVKFPFHYSNIKQRGYFKYIHIGMVLVALLLPCVPVVITLGTGDYTLMDFPTSVCVARDPDVIIYAILLPFSILMAGGISLIAVTLQELVLRHIGRPSSHLKGRKRLTFSISQFSTPELKVLIIFIYYFASAAFILVAIAEHAIIAPEFEEDLGEYFACETTGAKDCSRPRDRLGGRVVRTLSRSLLGLFPLVNLIYVVNVKEMKQKFSRCKL